MKIGIVTDSTCDLPLKTLNNYSIFCIPTQVIINGQAYIDWQDIHPVTLYQMMLTEGTSAFSTTPGVVETYVDCYRRALEQYDYVIGIHLSKKLSKVFELAQTALSALNAHDRVTLVDSTYVHSALASIVIGAAKVVQQGGDVDAVLEEVYRIRDNMLFLFSPQSLKWLVAYGRTPAAVAAFANLLNLRPLLTVRDGMASRQGLVRAAHTLPRLIKEMEESFRDTPVNIVFSTAGMAPTATTEFKKLVADSSLSVSSARLQMIGPSVGISVGPASVSMAAYPKHGEVFDVDFA